MIANATLAFIGLALSAGLTAQHADAQGTEEQRIACQDDAIRLCGDFIPDVEKIKACMVKKMRSLTPACRAQFAKGPAKSRHQ
jgi:hypothetical protein